MSLDNAILSYPATFAAGEALDANSLVKFDGNGALVYADEGDVPAGWVSESYALAALVQLRKLGPASQLIASGAVAPGDYVMCDDDGKVQTQHVPADPGPETNTPTEFTVGIALTTTTDDGDTIYVAHK